MMMTMTMMMMMMMMVVVVVVVEVDLVVSCLFACLCFHPNQSVRLTHGDYDESAW